MQHRICVSNGREGTILALNSTAAKRLGKDVSDFVGQKHQNIYEPQIPPSLVRFRTEKIRQVFKTGKPVDFEDERAGMIFHTVIYPVFDSAGKVESVAIFAQDITERKRLERALIESELRYRTLFDTSPIGVGLASIDGKVLAFNNAMLNTTGYSKEEIQQINLKDTYVDPQERTNIMEKLRANGLVRNFEVQLKRKDGTTYWASITISIFNQAGQDVILTVSLDITERKKAEEKIRTLSSAIEQSMDGISIADLEPKLLYVNKAYARMHGFSPEEMIGMPVANLHNKEKIDTFKADINQLKSQGFGEVEREHIKKDGTSFPIYISTTLLKNDEGQPIGILAGGRDITEQKKVQKALKIKDKAIDSSVNPIAITDTQGILTYVNDAFVKTLGYEDANQIIGKSIIDFAQKSNIANEALKELLTTGSWMGEIGGVKRDGSPIEVQLSANVVRGENGEVVCLMGSFIDVTESKKREKELDSYRQKIARAEQWASMGNLGAALAHELTQPLTVINLSIENMLSELNKTPHPETIVNRLIDVLAEVSKVNSITRKFRDAAKKSSEKAIKQVDLKAIAERTLKLFNESARRAKITLECKGLDELPHVYSSEEDMEQMLFALVENTIQAADGNKQCQLVISGKVKDDNVEMRFSDNCGGIAPENLDKIFEPFFTTKPAGQATGLGLCIVEHIVMRAGGKIHVESKLGEGTTFYVTLPIYSYAKVYPKQC